MNAPLRHNIARCAHCEAVFNLTRPDRKFCSMACRHTHEVQARARAIGDLTATDYRRLALDAWRWARWARRMGIIDKIDYERRKRGIARDLSRYRELTERTEA